MVVRDWGVRRLAVIPESQHDAEHNKAAQGCYEERPFIEPKQASTYDSSEQKRQGNDEHTRGDIFQEISKKGTDGTEKRSLLIVVRHRMGSLD
jgi:hypothetical protein